MSTQCSLESFGLRRNINTTRSGFRQPHQYNFNESLPTRFHTKNWIFRISVPITILTKKISKLTVYSPGTA